MMNSNLILINTFLSSGYLEAIENPISADFLALSDKVERAKRFVVFKDKMSSETEVKSIFSIVGNNDMAGYVPQVPLTIARNCFPNSNEANNTSFETIISEILRKNESEDNLAESLFYTFKQHAWALKSEKGQAYLSEFEYLKSQVAFTICLNGSKNTDYPFLLFCGDISGIQDFIYSIHSKKASKSLKGRSFYLQLLINGILEQYINATNTSVCNVIYSSGGKFFMLLPNSTELQEELQQLEQTITEELYAQHKESLSIMTAYVPFSIDEKSYAITVDADNCEDKVENLKDLWKAVSQKTSKKKQTKLSTLFDANFDVFFEGNMDKEYNDTNYAPCAVTGRPTKKKAANEINSEDEEKEYVTPLVQQQIRLGEDLRDAKYINVGESDFKVFKNASGVEIASKPSKNSIFINPKEDTLGLPFIFYGGNRQAFSHGKVSTFEELTIPDEGKNFNKLGVLRMDVDDLGHLFTGKDRSNETVTFATYSTLSSALDWFFSGYLNTIRNSEKYADYVNIIYAGGDDLFAVGRWDKLLEFAVEVRTEFRAYIGNNDSLKISAGLAVVNNKFPISKAASMAKDAIDEAKKYRIVKDASGAYDKNAIHLFGQTVSWAAGQNNELEFVLKLSNSLSVHLQNKTLSRAYFYKLYEYRALKDANNLSWYWQSAYNTGRYLERSDNHEVKNLLRAMQKALISKQFEYENVNITVNGYETGRVLDLICLAAQLADYYNR